MAYATAATSLDQVMGSLPRDSTGNPVMLFGAVPISLAGLTILGAPTQALMPKPFGVTVGGFLYAMYCFVLMLSSFLVCTHIGEMGKDERRDKCAFSLLLVHHRLLTVLSEPRLSLLSVGTFDLPTGASPRC